jgi:nucleotide-binding universal stress UspA family protein
MFSNILVAVDGGDLTDSVTEYAVHITAHADVHFVCAVDPNAFFSDAAAVVFDAVNEHAAAIEAAQRVIDRSIEAAKAAGITATGRVVEQPPVEAILDTARQIKANVIVMASHGRSGLARAVLGSVAEGVARRAGVAVLFVPKG